MEFIRTLLEQYLFLIPLTVLFLSEITKANVQAIREGDNPLQGHWLKHLFHPGGMPSTHSAFVTSLLIVIGRKTGVHSTEFAIAFVFASVVWYDAIAVRGTLGAQAAVLNRLQSWQHFRERLGHSFIEVLAGILFGAVVTIIGIAVRSGEIPGV